MEKKRKTSLWTIALFSLLLLAYLVDNREMVWAGFQDGWKDIMNFFFELSL